MKSRLFGLLLLPMLFCCHWAQAQTVIFDVTYDSSTVVQPSVVNLGDSVNISFSITNIGNTQFQGDILIQRRVDSVQVYYIDTLIGVVLGVGSTIPVIVNDPVIAPRYGGGINILVIWPAATMPGVAVSTVDTVIAELSVNSSTHLGDGHKLNSSKVYPNPAQHSLNLLLPDPNKVPVRFSIWSVDGREIRQFPAESRQFNLSGLPTGTYFLQIEYRDGFSEKKPFLLLN